MTYLLLILIYIVFISLGLPDSIIGSSWPSISDFFNINESMQGICTFIVSFFTIISSFLTPKLIQLFKEKGIVIISTILTILGLIGIVFSNNFILFCLSLIPLGFGAGAIDSTLNNYVAINYKAIHLNFLHAFWGLGASISPFIIGFFLTSSSGYKDATFILSMIQSFILFLLLISIKVWNKSETEFNKRNLIDNNNEENNSSSIGFLKTFKLKGLTFSLLAFFSYIAIEQTTSLWFSSMMVFGLNINENIAANWTSLFFIGITVGRFISGITSLKIKDDLIIRIGEGIILIGLILLLLQFNINLMPIALFVIGLGCAPIYPAIIHATPNRFTITYSQDVMSVQVGFAYIANITTAPLFGIIGEKLSFKLLPYYLLIFLIILIVCNEITLIKTKDKTKLLKSN